MVRDDSSSPTMRLQHDCTPTLFSNTNIGEADRSRRRTMEGSVVCWTSSRCNFFPSPTRPRSLPFVTTPLLQGATSTRVHSNSVQQRKDRRSRPFAPTHWRDRWCVGPPHVVTPSFTNETTVTPVRDDSAPPRTRLPRGVDYCVGSIFVLIRFHVRCQLAPFT